MHLLALNILQRVVFQCELPIFESCQPNKARFKTDNFFAQLFLSLFLTRDLNLKILIAIAQL